MNLTSPLSLIVLGGMLILSAVGLAVRALRPAPPRLSAVMAQLNAQPSRRLANRDDAPSARRSWIPAAAVAPAERHVGARDEDLAILGRSRAELAVTKIGWAVSGVLFPALVSTILTLGGVHLPFAIPLVASIGIGLFCWVNPSRQLAEDAEKARAEFRSALAAYLALVGLERKARGSATEALEEASRVSGSRPFRLIHTEVLRAELAGTPPWTALADLGTRFGVTELVSLAEIVATAADGAAVFATLLAEARSLHHAELTAQRAEANVISERLVQPLGLLAFGFVLLILIPPLLRLFTT